MGVSQSASGSTRLMMPVCHLASKVSLQCPLFSFFTATPPNERHSATRSSVLTCISRAQREQQFSSVTNAFASVPCAATAARQTPRPDPAVLWQRLLFQRKTLSRCSNNTHGANRLSLQASYSVGGKVRG
ncbi:hypothetical protein BaRGS_00018913 [Batillaria attramentaria]|uniref:Uncharacterized protein n=1 Tax=Batillaria attramentaria TaxID=370345 RepID=A0ABD0KSA7_9CAEN